jgi:hypothetical protein
VDCQGKSTLQFIHHTAIIIFALWLIGLGLKGTAIERQIKVCSNRHRSPYSVIFLVRIACQYRVIELPENLLEQAQALLVDYFSTLEKA